jgi:hypothetical protein
MALHSCRLAGAGAREQGKGLSGGPAGPVCFDLAAVAAPSLTWLCRDLALPHPGSRAPGATAHSDGLPGKPQLLMPERLPGFLEKNC